MNGVRTEYRSGGSLPGRLAAWLLGSRVQARDAIAEQLMNGLFASVPIFLGGVINTIAVAALCAWLYPANPLFASWLIFELVLGFTRVCVLIHGRRMIAEGRHPPRLLAAALSCMWAGSVGYGTIIGIASGDWVLSIVILLSASAMVCGICLRNFGTPRLAAMMMTLVLAPCAVAGLLASEPVLIIISLQLPVYMATIFSASFSLHGLMLSRMTALEDLQRSEKLNETILRSSPDYTIILNADHEVEFCHRPGTDLSNPPDFIGRNWVDMLPPEDKAAAAQMLEEARQGATGNLVTHFTGLLGHERWFDVRANGISDHSGRLMVVARDITHQKKSEEHALWMAHHDGLTGLPNRALLQNRLDDMLGGVHAQTGALLILDVDNFKAINDTLGHDAGDALLSTFAARLRAAVSEWDLVARTGGDEFAIIVGVDSLAEVEAIAQRIFEQLRQPFFHEGRLMECGASIGASFIPRDGHSRSEVMKAADIALYAAKADGRAQMKLFEPAMLAEVERHQTMIASARQALQQGTIFPYYQPKVSLRTSRIVGFEALLRWRDHDGILRGPDVLKAAFDDPALGGPLSDRILDKVLDDIRVWLDAGLDFGHVAINVTASDFRRGSFAETVLKRLSEKDVPPSRLQIEVTETVFLGRGAGYVEEALRRLSEHGIRIALDDFGTGYASLSHLNQFPVDLLKIDRSFISKIGTSPDAEAISATVINLGHCLGMEVIAEGIETGAQEAHLATVGCDTGQGFLYSEALPAEDIPHILRQQDASIAARQSA